MWARKRTTGRVEHFWIRPYSNQTDVWQPRCFVGLAKNSPRGIIKVSKGKHDTFFVLSPSGSQRCLTCLNKLKSDNDAYATQYRQRAPWKERQ